MCHGWMTYPQISPIDDESADKYAAELIGDDEIEGWDAAQELGKCGHVGGRILAAAARHPGASVRIRAAYGLTWLEEWSEAAEETLLALLRDPDLDVRAQACVTSVLDRPEMGRRAVGHVVQVLNDGIEARHTGAVYGAIDGLRRMGSAAGAAAPALVAFILRARREPLEWTSITAIDALGIVRSCEPGDVRVLLGELNAAPEMTARALKCYGSLAREAAPQLRELLDHADQAVRCAAAGALCVIDPDERAAELLVDLVGGRDEPIGLTALVDLGDIELPEHLQTRLRARADDDKIGVAALSRSLNDPDPSMRLVGAHFVRGYGIDAKPAVPLLRALLDDLDPWQAIGAASALARIEPCEHMFEDLEQLMDFRRPEVRKGAVLTINEIVTPLKRTLDRLRNLRDDVDPEVAKAAEFVLGEISARRPLRHHPR